jgi:transcriptional regulator with XRE-family HTH domain
MTESSIFSDKNTNDMNTNQLTAIRIKEERMRLNYSQQAIADHLGMDISNYSRLENGKVEITISKLEAIAEFFKVPMVNFLPNSLYGSINISNGNHSCIGTLINNYTDNEMQSSLKLVIELLQSQIKK